MFDILVCNEQADCRCWLYYGVDLLYQVLVRVPNVDTSQPPSSSCPLHDTVALKNFNVGVPQPVDDLVHTLLRQKAEITTARHDVCGLRLELLTALVKIYLLIAKGKGVPHYGRARRR